MPKSMVLALVLGGVLSAAAAAPEDPYLWLEQVDGPRAMDWVRAENAKTAAVLEKDSALSGAVQ